MKKTVFLSLASFAVLTASCSKNSLAIFSKKEEEPIIVEVPVPNSDNFHRADNFTWESLRKSAFDLAVVPQWKKDHSGFDYIANTPKGVKYYSYDFSGQEKTEYIDLDKLAGALTGATKTDIMPWDLRSHKIEWENHDDFTIVWKGQKYLINRKLYIPKPIGQKASAKITKTSVSPNGKYEVFIENHNLHLRDKTKKSTVALSQDGTELYVYGSSYGWDQIMKGENTHPEPNLAVSWSPDNKKVFTQIMDARNAKKMYLLDSSIDSLHRPELLSYFRGSPGDTDIVYYIPVIYDVETKKMTKLDMEPVPHFMDDLQGYGLKWSADSKYLYGTYNHRGYKQKDVIEVNTETGAIRTILKDKSETNIDYLTRFHMVEGKDLALMTSEKSGWKHIYSIDLKTGKETAVTTGEYVVKNIEAADVEAGIIYFTAAGKESGVNPYFNFLYSVNFDGSNLQLLTPEKLNHEVYVSPGFNYFIDNISSADTPTVSQLRSTKDGEVVSELSKADVSLMKFRGWNPPETFTATAQDGKTVIYGALWKPTNFNPNYKYPVIDYSYTGPHMNVYPNTFSKGVHGLYNSSQALAELGFIVVQIDGMGTAGRSKDFHNVSYKNMGNNLKDHTLAIKQLAAKYSWIDGNRVGIYGHSAGGYDAAHALMAFNDTYKVAVSSAADHDWRMEKAWWPEMYAGWPVDESYHEQSNITMAPQMKGKLLLIHGAIDENVNPSATYKLSEQLIKHGKDFEQIIVPSARHRYPTEYVPYLMKKQWNFFVDNLILNPTGSVAVAESIIESPAKTTSKKEEKRRKKEEKRLQKENKKAGKAVKSEMAEKPAKEKKEKNKKAKKEKPEKVKKEKPEKVKKEKPKKEKKAKGKSRMSRDK